MEATYFNSKEQNQTLLPTSGQVGQKYSVWHDLKDGER